MSFYIVIPVFLCTLRSRIGTDLRNQLTILSIPGATWRRHIGWYEFGRQPRATAIVKNQLLAALAQ